MMEKLISVHACCLDCCNEECFSEDDILARSYEYLIEYDLHGNSFCEEKVASEVNPEDEDDDL